MNEIDAAPFMQTVEMALKLAFFTVSGIVCLVALISMGVLLRDLWEGRND